MASLKEIIHEVHRRSLWQVLSVYVAGSWGTYQVVEMVVESTALPDWVLPLALVLLLVGLPIVVATAIVQEGVHLKHDEASSVVESAGAEQARSGGRSRANESGGRSIFTWRNTILGGLGAFALVGIISIGWLVRNYAFGDDPAVASIGGVELTSDPVASGDDAPPAEVDAGAQGDPSVDLEAATEPRVAESRVAAATPRPPPPPPPAAATAVPARDANAPSREGFDASRSAAEDARRRSQTLRAAETSALTWQNAESDWTAGESAAAAGSYAEAAAAMDRAAAGYAQANAETEAIWNTRVATARTELTDARSVSDPSSAGYQSAMRYQDEAARREGAGDLPGAHEALVEAANLYRAAQTGVGESAEPEEPAGPSTREIVTETFAQLSRALAAEDIASVRRVWISLTGQQASNFQTFFDSFDNLRATYEPNWSTMTERDGEIGITVLVTWRYADGNREQQQAPFDEQFVLSQRDGRWVISGG